MTMNSLEKSMEINNPNKYNIPIKPLGLELVKATEENNRLIKGIKEIIKELDIDFLLIIPIFII